MTLSLVIFYHVLYCSMKCLQKFAIFVFRGNKFYNEERLVFLVGN